MLMIVYISTPTPDKFCDFAAHRASSYVDVLQSSVLGLTTVCPTVDMETHQYSTLGTSARSKRMR